MPGANTLAMCVFGVVTGLLIGLPNRTQDRMPLDLDQVWQFWRNTAWMAWVGITIVAIALSPLTFAWKPYCASFFVTYMIVFFGAQAVLEGRLMKRWTAPMRALYRNEWYRYLPYQSKITDFFEVFSADHTAHFIGNAYVCAHLSTWAYRSEADILAGAGTWPAKVRVIQEKNHFGLVVRLPSAVIVAFRGTDDARDWLTNLSLWQSSPWGAEWGSVHAGFWGAVDALWPQITAALRELDADAMPVWFTGHSLGGAMAMLAAARLLNERQQAEIRAIYTFGQPMVGNREFVARYATCLGPKLGRFVATRDDIPNQPPRGKHGGVLLYFDRNGAMRQNPGRLSMFWDGMRRQSLGAAGDHPMREYLRLVEQITFESYLKSRERP
jgi:hypothetical protein